MKDDKLKTPEEDIQIFISEKERGNLEHAIFHLSCAIAADPTNPEWIGYLNELLNERYNLLYYVQVKEDNYYAVIAVKAYTMFYYKSYNEAFNLLGQVLKTVPNSLYLYWVIDWNDKLDDYSKIKRNTIISFMYGTMKSVDMINEELKFKILPSIISILIKSCKIYRGDYLLLWFLSAMQRRNKDFESALKSAEEAYDLNANYGNTICLALAYKELGEYEKAREFYEKGNELDPKDESCLLDLGDMYLGIDKYDIAKKYYLDALNRNPKNDWALPSVLYIDFLEQMNEESYLKLEEYSSKNPDNNWAKHLLSLAHKVKEYEKLIPYIDYIPEPQEAIINLLKQIIEKNPSLDNGGCINVTLSNMEAPSAINSFRLYLNDFGRKPNGPVLNLNIKSEEESKFIEETSSDHLKLWDISKNTETPCYTFISDKVKESVIEIAKTDYNFNMWSEKAKEVSKTLTKSNVDELLAIMLNPPVPSEGFTSWRWIKSIQYFSVFIIANLDVDYLYNICDGQLDWPIEPAIVYLANEANIDSYDVFYGLLKRMPKEGYCFYLYPLIFNWLRIKNLSEDVRQSLEGWKRDLEK